MSINAYIHVLNLEYNITHTVLLLKCSLSTEYIFLINYESGEYVYYLFVKTVSILFLISENWKGYLVCWYQTKKNRTHKQTLFLNQADPCCVVYIVFLDLIFSQ